MTKYGKAYIKRLDTDAVFFLRELWRELGKDAVHPLDDLFIEAWQFACGIPTEEGEKVNRTRGINMWRAAGKTTALVCPLAAFRLFRDQKRKVLILSKTDTAAKDTVAMLNYWFKNVWFLQHFQPRDDQKDRERGFNVDGHDGDKQNSVRALGIETQLEGNRGHTIIPDDIETKGNTKTLTARAALEHLTSELINVQYIPIPGQKATQRDPLEVVLFGTNKHEDTLSKRLVKKGWTFRSYPIAGPEPHRKLLGLSPYIRRLMDPTRLRKGEKLILPGQPTAPKRVDANELVERMKVGRLEFEREYQLYVDIDDVRKYPIRTEDVIVYPCHSDIAPAVIRWGKERSGVSTRIPDSEILATGFGTDGWYRPWMVDDANCLPYTEKAATIDHAGNGGDRIGCAYGGSLYNKIFVFEVEGLTGGPTAENINRIVERLMHYDITYVSVEGNNGGEYFARLIRARISEKAIEPGKDKRRPKGWNCTVDTHWATGRKETRLISTFDALFTSHSVVFDPRVARNEELQRQLTRLCDEANCLGHDDEADALEMLLSKLSTGLDRSDVKASEEATAEAYWEGLRAEMRGIHGFDTPDQSPGFLGWRQRHAGKR